MTSTAAILTVGDELMLGDRIDTNGPWLSRELRLLGIETIERRSTHDRIDVIAGAIKSLAKHCEVLLVTGGLGPTKDDRTREAFAAALDTDLVNNADAQASMAAWFEKREVSMPVANDVQAMVPETASWIPNLHGTAPGLLGSIGHCTVICLPGPPSELRPMFRQVRSDLCSSLDLGEPIMTIEMHSWGMAESIAGEKIEDLMQSEDPQVGILMGRFGITARVTGSDGSQLQEVAQEIVNRWSPWVYGNDDETIAASVGSLILKRKGSLTTAESCTGGLIAKMLSDVPGSSGCFLGGIVSYHNSLKQSMLDISRNIIETNGAVSEDVALAMARGIRLKTGADIGISTTGISGPGGGSTDKPVGLVYISVVTDTEEIVKKFNMIPLRKEHRRMTATTAINMVRKLIYV